MFNNLKLGKKIGLGFGLVLFLLCCVVGVGLKGFSKADKGIEHYRESVAHSNLMDQIQSNMLMVRLAVLSFLDTPSDKAVKMYEEHLDILNRVLNQTNNSITERERLDITHQIKQSIEQYNSAFRQLISDADQIESIYENELVPHGEVMRDKIARLINLLGYSGVQSVMLEAVELQRQMLVGRLYVVKYFESHQNADYQTALDNIGAKLEANIAKLANHLHDEPSSKLLAEFAENHQNYLKDVNQIHAVILHQDKLESEQLTVLGPQIANSAEKVKAMVVKEQLQLGTELEDNTNQSMMFTAVLSAGAILLGIIASIFLAKKITAPISLAVSAANQLASGDLTVTVTAHSKDETGILLDAIQNTASKLRTMIGTITQSSIELASASEELAVVTEQSTKGIIQQETETDLVATAMNEMAATVHDVANNASKASDAASHADKEASSGSSVVNLTIQSINDLHDNVNHSSGKLEEVEKQVINIGNILNVIKSIADQTNLLALNAAIEAARAGEQGRGFAVVADEVRSLAARTQDSTEEIQQIITHLQIGTKATVEAMTEGKTHALTCVEQAEQTHAALKAITDAIEQINEMNFQIASASEEQSTVAETINQNVENVRRIAQENAAGAEQTMCSSKEIAKLADQLNQLVVQFKI